MRILLQAQAPPPAIGLDTICRDFETAIQSIEWWTRQARQIGALLVAQSTQHRHAHEQTARKMNDIRSQNAALQAQNAGMKQRIDQLEQLKILCPADHVSIPRGPVGNSSPKEWIDPAGADRGENEDPNGESGCNKPNGKRRKRTKLDTGREGSSSV